MRLGSSLAVLVSALLLTPNARAAPPAVSWRAPSDCPDAEVVRAAIARALPPTTHAGTSSVEALVAHDDGAYRLDLTLRTAHGTSKRRLFAERCDTFVQLIALELSVVASSLPDTVVISEEADRRSDEAWPRLAWGGRASGGVGTGPLPYVLPRIALHGVLWHRSLRVELGVSYDPRRTLRYREPASIGARFELIAGQLRACHALAIASIELPLCAGVEAGVVRGRGQGVMPARAASRPWLAATAAAGLRWPRSALLAAMIQLEGSLALLRPTFGIRNLPPLYRPDRVDLRGVLGAELKFD